MDQKGVDEREETLFQKIQRMPTAEKIRLASRADKELRNLLIRDADRTVQLAVVGNPRITDSEITSIANSRNVNEEVLRKIGSSREWLKLYPVRVSLVQNPKTPVTIALKLLQTLMQKDLRVVAKSKNVSNTVARVALRYVSKREG